MTTKPPAPTDDELRAWLRCENDVRFICKLRRDHDVIIIAVRGMGANGLWVTATFEQVLDIHDREKYDQQFQKTGEAARKFWLSLSHEADSS